MPHSDPLTADQALDFALLHQTPPRYASRNRRALLWLLGLLLLLAGAVVALVLYLQTFEAEEEVRKRVANAQWLEQSVQFHFRRLEDDLLVLARQTVLTPDKVRPKQPIATVQGGLLWREPGVVLSHGWLAGGRDPNWRVGPQRWTLDWAAHPANAQALATMQDTTRGLRRSAYAGLMQQADGGPTDVVWLAVPFFDRGEFAGNYLAALSLNRAVQALVPPWYAQNHGVRLIGADAALAPNPLVGVNPYHAAMNLPGADLLLEVSSLGVQPATVPRVFFLVALLFLLGMLASLLALRRDFVKRQQVQARLQAEVALRTAMENSVTIGLRAWDRDGKILYVNDAFCRLVGYPAQALVGQSNPLPYWPVDQASELQLVHREALAQGTPEDGVEVQFQHSDGRLLDVLIHEAPLNTATGAQLGWMSSVLDISERKRAQRMAALQQEKLEASGRLVAVGEVASTLAHELNQPLGALSSFANGLLNRLRGGTIKLADMEPVVARMARLAERAGGIIQRINAFARRREISRQRLDLSAVLQRVLGSMGDVQGRAVVLVQPRGPIWIEADELLLAHLINNLVGNALDWALRGTALAQVRVALTRDTAQGMAVIAVGDSGPGVPAQEQASIFNAFFSTKEGGMGMGLAICRSIVEAHHGRIAVGRDPDLGGACFTVSLPLLDSPTNALPAPAPTAMLGNQGNP